jgi:hypothetical protein
MSNILLLVLRKDILFVKRTFQHTDLRPFVQGLPSPSSLTDFLKSSRLAVDAIVVCHLVLHIC